MRRQDQKKQVNTKEMFPWPEEFKLDKKGRFLGKSQKHWRQQARELYAECLVRASVVSGGVVGTMVTARILGILKKEDPEMLVEKQAERARARFNMCFFVSSFAPTPAERRASKKKKRG